MRRSSSTIGPAIAPEVARRPPFRRTSSSARPTRAADDVDDRVDALGAERRRPDRPRGARPRRLRGGDRRRPSLRTRPRRRGHRAASRAGRRPSRHRRTLRSRGRSRPLRRPRARGGSRPSSRHREARRARRPTSRSGPRTPPRRVRRRTPRRRRRTPSRASSRAATTTRAPSSSGGRSPARRPGRRRHPPRPRRSCRSSRHPGCAGTSSGTPDQAPSSPSRPSRRLARRGHDVPRVPADAGVDVRVVDAGGGDADQDVSSGEPRHRKIVPVDSRSSPPWPVRTTPCMTSGRLGGCAGLTGPQCPG